MATEYHFADTEIYSRFAYREDLMCEKWLCFIRMGTMGWLTNPFLNLSISFKINAEFAQSLEIRVTFLPVALIHPKDQVTKLELLLLSSRKLFVTFLS